METEKHNWEGWRRELPPFSGRKRERQPGETLNRIKFIFPEDITKQPGEDEQVFARRLVESQKRAVGSLNFLLDSHYSFGQPALLESDNVYEHTHFLSRQEREVYEKALGSPTTDELPELIDALDTAIQNIKTGLHNKGPSGESLDELIVKRDTAQRLRGYSMSAYRRQNYGAMLMLTHDYRDVFKNYLKGDYKLLELSELLSNGMNALGKLNSGSLGEDIKIVSADDKLDDAISRAIAEKTRVEQKTLENLVDSLKVFVESFRNKFPLADVDLESLNSLTSSNAIDNLKHIDSRKNIIEALQLVVAQIRRELGVSPTGGKYFPDYFAKQTEDDKLISFGPIKTPPEIIEAIRQSMINLKTDIQANVKI